MFGHHCLTVIVVGNVSVFGNIGKCDFFKVWDSWYELCKHIRRHSILTTNKHIATLAKIIPR